MTTSRPSEVSAESSLPSSRPWEAAFVALSCVMLHFMIGQPAGYPLTIAPVAVALVLWLHYSGRISVGALAALCVLLLVPLINVVGRPADNLVRFLRTDALWAFNVTALWWAARGTLAAPRGGVARGAFAALVVIAGFSAAQSSLAFLTGSTALFNPFRGRQYLHEYDAALHNAGVGGWSRAQGFYLEPSFGALVMLSLCVVLLLARHRTTASMLIVAFGLFFNRSFSGVIAFALIAAIHVGLSLGRQVSRTVKLAAAATCVVLAGVALRQLLAARLGELTVEGASAYYRIISPLIVLRDVLRFHPLGVEMGQIEAFMTPYGLLQTGSEGTTLDNGLYVLVFYFGWIGLATVAAMMVTSLIHILAGQREKALFWTFVVLSMAFSGAILVPEYALLMVLVLYQFRVSRSDPGARRLRSMASR